MNEAANPSDLDPMPQPPSEVDLDACCGNGCEPCILDFYQDALDRYRADLGAWQARQAAAS